MSNRKWYPVIEAARKAGLPKIVVARMIEDGLAMRWRKSCGMEVRLPDVLVYDLAVSAYQAALILGYSPRACMIAKLIKAGELKATRGPDGRGAYLLRLSAVRAFALKTRGAARPRGEEK